MIFCTLATTSHLNKAKILAKSIKKFHPNSKVIVCLVERNTPRDKCPFYDDVILAEGLGINNFDTFIFKYDVFEASCALKGALLQHMLKHYVDENHIVYFDSDIKLYSPLHELENALKNYPIVLTPHVISDPDTYYVWHGMFNAGFIAISRRPDAEKFVQWWSDRIQRYCYKDWHLGLYDDQCWLKFAPTYFDVYILKHPGYNVAFWNVGKNKRNITMLNNSMYTVENEPLRFFHFSNLNKALKRIVRQSAHSALHQLYDEYVAELRSMRSRSAKHQWSYACFSSKEPIQKHSREIYRNNMVLQDIIANPFGLSNSFLQSDLSKQSF